MVVMVRVVLNMVPAMMRRLMLLSMDRPCSECHLPTWEGGRQKEKRRWVEGWRKEIERNRVVLCFQTKVHAQQNEGENIFSNSVVEIEVCLKNSYVIVKTKVFRQIPSSGYFRVAEFLFIFNVLLRIESASSFKLTASVWVAMVGFESELKIQLAVS